ncbi:hypothetical protein Goarm_019946 [Gossypium armourianum]|uniref:Uncharacterized protein n=1 Tax=Gossypium armourianum TaxID=34283 RepID=A0A7J9IM32_9ROSI|nr:hypothetical protein [Gossypium armourianum]
MASSRCHYSMGYLAHKPYHEEILKAIQEYHESIPDPTEWSQDYP